MDNDDNPLPAAIRALAGALTPPGAHGEHDAAGVYVRSLTEGAMGVTAGLLAIAEALRELAAAVRDAAEP